MGVAIFMPHIRQAGHLLDITGNNILRKKE